ncbi:MAG TPA: pilus assembly protein PilC [Opitutae bacterium]|nr:pilus assembly protein PilC [Opitutaceae bacterium]HCR30060.1 pilus assembly protein PilC [Opitutae bacterium]|tara:strand:- start:581 stop:1855 length:1275 start_codon:yes stop_codon:yes gene_type:complete
MKFEFVALDSSGEERRGMVEAPNRELATTQIKSYGLTPARVKVVKNLGQRARKGSGNGLQVRGDQDLVVKKPSYFGAAVKGKGLAIFTRQLSTLLQNGLSLIKSLEVLVAQERNPAFRWVLSQQLDNIRSGNTFSEGLSKYPKEFDNLYLNMVKAGEASGTLDLALSRLAHYLNKARQIRSKVTQASIYPAVVFSFSVLIVLGLMTFVVPRFAAIFDKQLNGEQLPVLTRVVMEISLFITGNLVEIGVGLIVFFLLFAGFRSTRVGTVFFAFLKLRLPLVKDTFSKMYVSRFCRTLGTLLESGVPILEALNYSRAAVGNQFIMDAVEKVRNRVRDGEPLAEPMAASGQFPPMVSSMVEVGEETGELPDMLNQIADIYDEEVDASISSVTSVIEPILILTLAISVLLIAISLFLPFIKLMQNIAQ